MRLRSKIRGRTVMDGNIAFLGGALLVSQVLTTVQIFLMRRRVDSVERSIRPQPFRWKCTECGAGPGTVQRCRYCSSIEYGE